MLLLSLLVTASAAVAQAPTAQPTTPAECVKAAREFALARQRTLKQVTAEAVRQVTDEKVAMAQRCAAQFSVTTVAEADLPALIALYGESAQPALAKTALDRALGSRSLPTLLRAEVLAQAVTSGLRDYISPARNARLEGYADELDRLDAPNDALLDIKITTHTRLNAYYRGDDIDDGIIKHSTWLINRSKTFSPAQRTQYASHIMSAAINMAEALAGRGRTTEAQALLASTRSDWSDSPLAPRMLDPIIDRYALIGTVGAPITATRWLNAPPNTTMPMTGAVTLLEFTAHWCVPCKESYPGLRRLLAKYSPQGFRIVLATELYGYFGTERPLTPEEEVARDRDYFAKEGLAVPVAIAARAPGVDNPNDAAYNVGGIPQIQILDRHGRIRLIMVGYDETNEPFLASLIEKLLREK